MASYFLILVSTRENLDSCKRYAMAGFPGSGPGLWAFEDIGVGDYLSFLHGAKAHNLYRVREKLAFKNAGTLPPWPPLIFRSGLVYHFPYRLFLEPVREFSESLVREEFSYVSENLLLRGGYKKTHFQADQTTLQNASRMGTRSAYTPTPLSLDGETFIAKYSQTADRGRNVFKLREFILQSILRRYLSQNSINSLVSDPSIAGIDFEILGEKALSVGNVDLLAKEAHPTGSNLQIPIEVKMGDITKKAITQVKQYATEIGDDAVCSIVIGKSASKFAKEFAKQNDVLLFTYSIPNLPHELTFDEACQNLALTKIS